MEQFQSSCIFRVEKFCEKHASFTRPFPLAWERRGIVAAHQFDFEEADQCGLLPKSKTNIGVGLGWREVEVNFERAANLIFLKQPGIILEFF